MRPIIDRVAPCVLRANTTTVAMRPAVATKVRADVVASTTALATRSLAVRRIRALLRITANRIPALALIAPPISPFGSALPLEVIHGVLRVAASKAIDVGSLSAACKKGVVMARRTAYACTGVITADGSTTGNAVAVRLTHLRPPVP